MYVRGYVVPSSTSTAVARFDELAEGVVSVTLTKRILNGGEPAAAAYRRRDDA